MTSIDIYLDKIKNSLPKTHEAEKFFEEFKINLLEEWTDFLLAFNGNPEDIVLQKKFLRDKEDPEVIGRSLMGQESSSVEQHINRPKKNLFSRKKITFYEEIFKTTFWTRPLLLYITIMIALILSDSIQFMLFGNYAFEGTSFGSDLENYCYLIGIFPIILFIIFTVYNILRLEFPLVVAYFLRTLFSLALYINFIVIANGVALYLSNTAGNYGWRPNINLILNIVPLIGFTVLVGTIGIGICTIIPKLIKSIENNSKKTFIKNYSYILWSTSIKLDISFLIIISFSIIGYNTFLKQNFVYFETFYTILDLFILLIASILISSFFVYFRTTFVKKVNINKNLLFFLFFPLISVYYTIITYSSLFLFYFII